MPISSILSAWRIRPWDRPLRKLSVGVELEGNYLFFVYRFIIIGFILNMIGEELYYRAALLPKMRAVFGNDDWVANGIGFAAKHLYYWWRVPVLVPAGLGLAFYLGPMRSLPLAILAHRLTGEIILFFLSIAELFGIARGDPHVPENGSTSVDRAWTPALRRDPVERPA